MGCNAVSWAPAIVPGSLVSTQPANQGGNVKKIATGGCDNLVKIWAFEFIPDFTGLMVVKRGIRGLRRRRYRDMLTGFVMFLLLHLSECQRHILLLLLKYTFPFQF